MEGNIIKKTGIRRDIFVPSCRDRYIIWKSKYKRENILIKEKKHSKAIVQENGE